nr:hypothetical protein GCM10020093_036000 [Planobispora longispora]
MEPVVAVLLVVVLVSVPALVLWRVLRGRRDLGSSPAERATFETLHTASLAAPPLRAGLTETGAQKASRHLRALLGSPALAITDEQGLLVYDGEGDHHAHEAFANAARTLADGRTQVLGPEVVSCDLPECPIRFAVVVPLTTDGRVVGSLAAYGGNASAGLVRAAHEVARWVDSQLELAELDRSRTRLMEAEVRALRAQISPHFIYNSLTTIASFVRSDPDRSRELLLDFADFTRYSFRRHGSSPRSPRSCAPSTATSPWSAPASATSSRSHCASRPRCSPWRCRSCACSPWWRTRYGTAWRASPASAASPSSPRTPGPSAGSASRTTGSAWTPTGSAESWPGTPTSAPGPGSGPGQRGRAAAPGLRRRVRPGRGDRQGGGHEGQRPPAQVPPRRLRPLSAPVRRGFPSAGRPGPSGSSPALAASRV